MKGVCLAAPDLKHVPDPMNPDFCAHCKEEIVYDSGQWYEA